MLFDIVLYLAGTTAALRLPFVVDLRYKGFSIAMYVRKLEIIKVRTKYHGLLTIINHGISLCLLVTRSGHFVITVKQKLHIYNYESSAQMKSLEYWNELIVIGPKGIMEGMKNMKHPFRVYLNGEECGYRFEKGSRKMITRVLQLMWLGGRYMLKPHIIWIANAMITSSNLRDMDIKKQTGMLEG